MRFITYALFSIVILASLDCSKSPSVVHLHSPVDSIVACIAAENVLTSSGVGYAGTEPEQWRNYLKLEAQASDEELCNLVLHQNPVVRCYAFQALAHRQYANTCRVLLEHISDTVQVRTFFGCVISAEPVAEYLIEVVTPECIDTSFYKLNADERSVLDSVLLYRPQLQLEARAELLARLAPAERHYARVKQIASEEPAPEALPALARFQKSNDVPFIRAILRKNEDRSVCYAIRAVRENPDTAFLQDLLSLFEAEWGHRSYNYQKWRNLYQALARYPCSQTLSLFNRTLDCRDEFRKEILGMFLGVALAKYPNSLYDSLRMRIAQDKALQKDVAEELESETAT